MSFLVLDDTLVTEDIIIGLPVLQHLGIDSRTLFERNSDALDGTSCSTVAHRSVLKSCGTFGRLMVS